MKSIIKFVLIFLVIISSGLCFNLGSYAKQSHSVFHNGDAEFGILIWTTDEIPLNISFAVSEKPAEMDVNIFPESVLIDSSTGSELVSSGNAYANASMIKIVAHQQYGCGNGTIKIIAKSSYSTEGIGTSQERIFRLYASGTPCNETKESINAQPFLTTTTFEELKNNSQSNNTISSNTKDENSNFLYFFIFVLSIIILLICAAKVLKEGF